DTLPTKSMAEALRWITMDHPIDVIYLDGCLMSTAEVAAELAPYAKYIVAHENLTWAIYPYSRYLDNVSSNTSPRDLARHIARVTRDSWPAVGHPAQVGVLDASKTQNVLTKLDTLARVLSDTLVTDRAAISESATLAARVDENGDSTINITGDD